MPDGSLLLLGHGSHLDQNSSKPVHAMADQLAALKHFRRVDVAFWKEEPAVSRWNDRYRKGETVVAVPVFISDGYFTREVLPRELGLDGGGAAARAMVNQPAPTEGRDYRRANVHGIDLRYTRPVGAHSALAGVIRDRANEAGAGPADAVVVLGHGTRRNPDSELNVYSQASTVRAMGLFSEVVTVFMEQPPEMARVFELTAARRVFMVPLFIAEGWHVGQTIPEEMEIDGGEVRQNDRTLIYTPPVGTHPAMANVVVQLANEALA